IVQIAQIAVAQRAGVPLKTANVAATKFRMTPVDVSATEVRCLLAEPLTRNEQRVAAMVPTRVLDYIRQHNLYRTD
ncbi:MAG: hypothetical protein ACRECQ_04620, partial [Burkholderiaceae bacterium]